ncbi:protein SCAI-like isoform X2 [Rhopilema esculentum]|uniref:protein SCAI-like isoform X2 n=1 Tax=Rhopilema esculentum TaxID=499914 RepID=UPI0031D2E01B
MYTPRAILDQNYNLKRWQIGEIASKIGQLYYHYYLRTSEANYLFEAFQFYSAIRTRNYFNHGGKDEESSLLPKKLRYYARFLVVCLLMNETNLIRDLTKELKRLVNDYTNSENAADHIEWQLVLKEIVSFVEADNVLTVLEEDLTPVRIKHRVVFERIPGTFATESPAMKLKEVIIVGNCEKQTKFSELTLDMFRFLQCVEREPSSLQSYSMKVSSSGPVSEPVDDTDKIRHNPHKYLLYKPSFGQLITFLGAAFKDLPGNSIMLLYISADATFDAKSGQEEGFYETGGVCTKKAKSTPTKRSGRIKESNCLYPEDVMPFTRKPLMLIVDSPNSIAFRHIPKLFGQPVVCLMSPIETTEAFSDQKNGGLFTLFLHDPLLAFCTICNAKNLRLEIWNKCQSFLDKIFSEILEILYSLLKEIDFAYEQFLGDEFLRLILLKFIFCFQSLRLHKDFKGASYYPSASPSISNEVLNHKGFARHLLELASLLDARDAFNELSEVVAFEMMTL